MMTEEDVRAKIAEIDDKRKRANTLNRMAEWPMFVPSTVKSDKRSGVFRWFGTAVSNAITEVELTREERSELRDWLYAKSVRLEAEAAEIAASLRVSS